MGGVELQTNWSMVRVEHRLEELLRTETAGRMTMGYNIHERLTKWQQGGTSIAIFDALASYCKAPEHDPSGLVRWTSFLLEGKDGHRARIASAYIPCQTQKGRYTTVYTQHCR